MTTKEVIEVLTKEVGTSFYDCKSSNIVGYGYQSKDKALWVIFKGNKVYRYTPIEEAQFKDLMTADSKGKWVNANLIKTKVNYQAYEIV